jgi:hypothetical protein
MPLFSVVGQIVSQAQVITIVANFNVNYPDMIKVTLDVFMIFVFDVGIFKPSCYFGFGLAARYLPNVMLPLLIIIAMLVYFLLSKITSRITGTQMVLNSVFNSLGIVLSSLSVAVFKASLSILECRENPSAHATLMHHDGFRCYGDEVVALLPLTIVMSLGYIGLFVGTYGYVLLMGPRKFHESQVFRARFRFVMSRWHPTYYWWGALQVTRNLAMCLVPIVTTDGLIQLALTVAIFMPLYLVTLGSVWCTVGVMSAFLVAEPTEAQTRNTIGGTMVGFVVVSFVVVLVIFIDMLRISVGGKGVFVNSNQLDPELVDTFVETMAQWSQSTSQRDDVNAESARFLGQLPDVDQARMEWIMNLMSTGLFGQRPSKRLSGISPVAPVLSTKLGSDAQAVQKDKGASPIDRQVSDDDETV